MLYTFQRWFALRLHIVLWDRTLLYSPSHICFCLFGPLKQQFYFALMLFPINPCSSLNTCSSWAGSFLLMSLYPHSSDGSSKRSQGMRSHSCGYLLTIHCRAPLGSLVDHTRRKQYSDGDITIYDVVCSLTLAVLHGSDKNGLYIF